MVTYPDHPDGLPKLKPLPILSVVREDYCSQEATNKIVSYLEGCAQDKLYSCMYEESSALDLRNKPYSNLIYYVIEHKDLLLFDASDIALVDLSYEVSRRIRVAYNMPEVKIVGKPLTDHIDGIYPPLLKMEINTEVIWKGLTQDLANRVLEIFYGQNKALCFSIGEAYRRNLMLGFLTDKSYKKIKEILENLDLIAHSKILRPDVIGDLCSHCHTELHRRLRRMCLIAT